MATILWDQEIDKTIDWAGDVNTGNAPVSGKYVQKFIKDTLAKKFGYMYYDRSALKYLVFADEDDYNTYSLDPTNNSGLLLATFDAPAPATISIVDSSDYNVTTLLTAIIHITTSINPTKAICVGDAITPLKTLSLNCIKSVCLSIKKYATITAFTDENNTAPAATSLAILAFGWYTSVNKSTTVSIAVFTISATIISITVNIKHKNSALVKLKNKLNSITITAIANCCFMCFCVVVAYIIPLKAFSHDFIKFLFTNLSSFAFSVLSTFSSFILISFYLLSLLLSYYI